MGSYDDICSRYCYMCIGFAEDRQLQWYVFNMKYCDVRKVLKRKTNHSHELNMTITYIKRQVNSFIWKQEWTSLVANIVTKSIGGEI